MRRITAPLGALALALFAATSAAAAEIVPKADELVHRIAVVNDFDAPMVVYAEGSDGEFHEVVTLNAGEVKLVDAQIDETGEGSLRLHARPTNSASRWSTWGDRGIVTDVLRLTEDETAILWIARNLAESSVEIRG